VHGTVGVEIQDLSVSLRAVVDDAASRWVSASTTRTSRTSAGRAVGTPPLCSRLATLRAAGILTSEEFQAKRGQVLSRFTTEAPNPDRM
jgi:hypothetical protein